MSDFLSIHIDETRKDISKNAYVDAVMEDEAIAEFSNRVDVVGSLYGDIRVFVNNQIRCEVLGRFHVGQLGIGKSVLLQRGVSILPQFFDGLATAFVSLGRFNPKLGFGEPPHPRDILKMIKAKDININKLFVMYDDFEKSYENEWGPSLAQSIYCSMNKNIETMVHVLGSRYTPITQLLDTALRTGRCSRFTPILQPCLEEDQFYRLLVSIFEQHQIGKFEDVFGDDENAKKDARKAGFVMYWLSGGNARKIVKIALLFKKYGINQATIKDDKFEIPEEDLWSFLAETPEQYSQQIFDTMNKYIVELQNANDHLLGAEVNLGAAFTTSAMTMDDISRMIERNYFLLRGVDINAVFLDNYIHLNQLVDAGILIYDSQQELVYPGTPFLIPWFALCRDEKIGEDRRKKAEAILKGTGSLIYSAIKSAAFWKIRGLFS